MISKSLRNAMARSQRGLVVTQSRGMGGGKAKPNMPASQTDFDIVLVGKYNLI
jgi:hypothetical protein